MTKALARLALVLVFASGLAYASDYAILRYRIWRRLTAYGSVTVNSYYAIQEKNNRTEYVFNTSQAETCVNSWFPHFGYVPCWYLRGHADRQIPI